MRRLEGSGRRSTLGRSGPEAFDFPSQGEVEFFLNTAADFFAQVFQIGGGRGAIVNHEIAVFFGHIRPADFEAAAIHRVD